MDKRVYQVLGCSVWISKGIMVVIESSFPRRKVFGMVFKSVFLYGKMGGKQRFPRKCILDYQTVKCSVWIYSI